MVLPWFYKHSWFTPIGPFALVLALKSDFAAQPYVENDVGIFIRYAISMFDTSSFVVHASVFIAQGASESDAGISMKYDFRC